MIVNRDLSGPKSLVRSFRNYLVMVSPPFFPSSASNSATVRNYVTKASNPTTASQTDISKVIVYNLENKFTAYSESVFSQGVRDVICDHDYVYIVGNDGKVTRLLYLESALLMFYIAVPT